MLASLVVRLALAETFCHNCGVLALDEPTSNLDGRNIQGFTEALGRIVNDRKQAKNSGFQLIVISHDNEFIDNLARCVSQCHCVCVCVCVCTHDYRQFSRMWVCVHKHTHSHTYTHYLYIVIHSKQSNDLRRLTDAPQYVCVRVFVCMHACYACMWCVCCVHAWFTLHA